MAKEASKIRKKLKDIILNAIPILQEQGFSRIPHPWFGFGYHPGIGYEYNLVRTRREFVEMIEITAVCFGTDIAVEISVLKSAKPIQEVDSDVTIYYRAKSKWENFCYLHQRSFLDRLLGRRRGFCVRKKTEPGIRKELMQIDTLLRDDFNNIDYFFEKWYKENTPLEIIE